MVLAFTRCPLECWIEGEKILTHSRFDLPILGSLDGFTEVHLDSSRANMPLMHKAVWHLLNHIEFVARRHAHKDLNISLDRQNRKQDELLTWNKPLFPCCGWSP